MDNRGKRSVVLDLKTDEGKAAIEHLLAGADVYLSNLRDKALRGLGLGMEEVSARHPHLVCALLTGYGRTGGPADDKPGYEGSGFWARSSAAWQHGSGSEYPPLIQPGFGDHTTSLSMVGGVLAALLAAKTTGKGQVVETSLMRTGIYCNGWPISSHFARADVGRGPATPMSRQRSGNPLNNIYKAGDGQLFFLMQPSAQRHWPANALVLGLDKDDERFATARDRSASSPSFSTSSI